MQCFKSYYFIIEKIKANKLNQSLRICIHFRMVKLDKLPLYLLKHFKCFVFKIIKIEFLRNLQS